MPRGPAPADLAGGQELFRLSAVARIVGEHHATTCRRARNREMPTVDTPDGRRVTAETLRQRLGQVPGAEPVPRDRRPWLRPFAKKQSGEEPEK